MPPAVEESKDEGSDSGRNAVDRQTHEMEIEENSMSFVNAKTAGI
jgi:hypothetical protein